MRKNKYILLLTITLAVIALILLLNNSKSTIKADFAVDDLSSVTKIFMSDKNNNKVTIKRLDEGKDHLPRHSQHHRDERIPSRSSCHRLRIHCQ